MPDYIVYFSNNDGQSLKRVVTAESPHEASKKVVASGARVLKVSLLPPPKVQTLPATARGSANPPRGATGRSRWSDFWTFRLLITPYIARWLFILATVSLMVQAAWAWLSVAQAREDYSAEVLRPVRDVLQRLETADEESQSLHDQISGKSTELQRLSEQPETRIAQREISDEIKALESQRQAIFDTVGCRDSAELNAQLVTVRARLATLRASMPNYVLAGVITVLTPIAWLILRLVFEWELVFFSIHDRLVEIADA